MFKDFGKELESGEINSVKAAQAILMSYKRGDVSFRKISGSGNHVYDLNSIAQAITDVKVAPTMVESQNDAGANIITLKMAANIPTIDKPCLDLTYRFKDESTAKAELILEIGIWTGFGWKTPTPEYRASFIRGFDH